MYHFKIKVDPAFAWGVPELVHEIKPEEMQRADPEQALSATAGAAAARLTSQDATAAGRVREWPRAGVAQPERA